MLADEMPDLGTGAVAVVGENIDQNGDTGRPVSFVGRFLVGGALEIARALGDGPGDIVLGHVGRLGGLDACPEAGVSLRVAAADAGGDGDFPNELGEDLAPLGVGRALFPLDGAPF